MRRDLRWNERGVTLIETMIALAAGAVVVGGLYVAFIFQTQIYRAQNQVVDMIGTAKAAMHILNKDLRIAGYSPMQGASVTGVTYNPTQLLLQEDLNGNGVTTDPGESIAYSYNAGGLQLVRSPNGRPTDTFLNIQGFTLSYLDATGAPTTVSTNIRQVVVSLTARTALPDPNWPTNQGYRTYAMQLTLVPRNL
jgi:type IV pilus assembly protein PilW